MFARHGIPMTLMSDNGPQFSFKTLLLSPHNLKPSFSAIKWVSSAHLQGSKDPFMAFLSYRTTPMPWCHLSPAGLLMGRQLKTDVPQTKDCYIPKWPHI